MWGESPKIKSCFLPDEIILLTVECRSCHVKTSTYIKTKCQELNNLSPLPTSPKQQGTRYFFFLLFKKMFGKYTTYAPLILIFFFAQKNVQRTTTLVIGHFDWFLPHFNFPSNDQLGFDFEIKWTTIPFKLSWHFLFEWCKCEKHSFKWFFFQKQQMSN